MNLRFGPRIGIQGKRFGPSDRRVVLSGVTQDPSSLLYFPANASEWTTTLGAAGDAAGGPSDQWSCQDASGALANAIGSITLAAGGTAASYRQTVPGGSRLGIAGSDGATTTFSSTNAGLPDPTTTSYLLLLMMYLTAAPASQRTMLQYGTTLPHLLALTTTPILRLQGGGLASGTKNPTSSLRPVWFQYYVPTDAIGPRGAIITDQEPRTTTKRASVSKNLILSLNFSGYVAGVTLFTGAAAQRSNAQLGAINTVLGFSNQW